MKVNVYLNGQSCRHGHATIRAAINCYRIRLRLLGIARDSAKLYNLCLKAENQ